MKKGIEQEDLPINNNHSWLAEHDYSCKYPLNCDILVEDDSGSESENEIHFNNIGSCSTTTDNYTDSENDDDLNCESETSSNESSSESNDTHKHVWPWMDKKSLDGYSDAFIPLSSYEEHVLLEDLETAVKMIPNENLDQSIYRLHSKLKLRLLKRSQRCKYFNFDNYLHSYHEKKSIRKRREGDEKNHKVKNDHTPSNDVEDTLLSRGVYPDVDVVRSQYTNRTLKPFIWRDALCRPPYLRLLHELKQQKCVTSDDSITTQDFIDYSYLKPQHIQTINNLCCRYFWPGINVKDTLRHPDFSCVALYKKLIVGFAFLDPDFSPTETYLTFLFTRPQWRGAGLASFMIYHLIQTCVGKDIILHVAADNPAILLYQKFGFKVEQFIYNFYDKYIPVDNQRCKHALFLRLSR
ncbi:hypothetical protein LSTR_LSTR000209 [Laodelphax striatellus]|uniref:N-acetyltransferase domain-containing protein n=1 Tax=Laodelphax striatellus TaxID=195883 RepID=A0A482X6F0_LAOST|nr:hypothetical protein LSTR_LSTR000209 [Laodelphax striatellus]